MTLWIGVVIMAIALVWFAIVATCDVTCRYRSRSEGFIVTFRPRRSRHRANSSGNSYRDIMIAGGSGGGSGRRRAAGTVSCGGGGGGGSGNSRSYGA